MSGIPPSKITNTSETRSRCRAVVCWAAPIAAATAKESRPSGSTKASSFSTSSGSHDLGVRPILSPWSQSAAALSMSRREMLGERQVAASLMAQRAAHRALSLAHRRFQPGEGVSIQLAGLGLGGKPQRPAQCHFGHETLVLAFALIAPAASRPGQHRAVRWQRGRQMAPCGHPSTVGQRFLRLVPPEEPRPPGRPSV